MSTWFDNYQTKTVHCRECQTEIECHVESEITMCTDCAEPYLIQAREKALASLGGMNT